MSSGIGMAVVSQSFANTRKQWKGKGQRDFSNMNKLIAGAWRNLSEEERDSYRVKAMKIQGQRSAVARTPLNEQVSADDRETLSRNQHQRLNHVRLDGALAQVSEHPAWKSGLGLADHLSGLRAEHIDLSLAETDNADDGGSQLDAAMQAFFGYDSKIQSNQELPAFGRACLVAHGGICASGSFYKHVAQLVEQFDSILAFAGKLSRRVLVKFTVNLREWTPTSGAGRVPSEMLKPIWFALGCTARKPKAHILIGLNLQRLDSCLCIQEADGVPCLETSHQFFQRLLARHHRARQQLCHFGLEAHFGWLIA